MALLRKGSTGADVEKWQTFLRGTLAESKIVISGVFDDVTEEETKIFQKMKGLDADGIVGPKSMALTMQATLPTGEVVTADSASANWPPKPGHGPLSLAERQNVFGKFAFTAAPTASNPEAINITDGWGNNNIVTVVIPQLVGVSGATKTGGVQLHKAIAPQVVKMFQAWEDAGHKGLILSWGGSWVPRFIRGSRTSLSNHSWGTAFDMNMQWNGLGVVPALKGTKGSVRELVEIAYAHGMYWGGWFPSRADGMHFEAYKVV